MNGIEYCQKIHEASLEILDSPGIKLDCEETVKLLLDNGARSGTSSGIVRIPVEMVEEALEACPESFSLYNSSGNGNVLGADSPTQVWSIPGLKLAEGEEVRNFNSGDMVNMSRLVNSLDQIDGVFGVSMNDIEAPVRDFTGLRIMLCNTAKHIRVLSCSAESCEALIEMMKVIGNKPCFSMGFTAHGPLRWTKLALDIFRASAGHGIPVTINGEPMAGVSGPITLAGSIAVGNAEILAGIVINQLIEPHRPCIYNLGLAHIMDMRTMLAVTGAPENALFARASADMGRFYGLPSCSWVSTDSMTDDAQASAEKAIGFQSHIDAGVSLIWGAGQLESEMTVSFTQAVIDNELIAYCRKLKAGIAVDDDSIALDVIREVGIMGDYLQSEHTLNNFKNAFFEPELMWRYPREKWQQTHSTSLQERASQKVKETLSKKFDSVISEDKEQELLKIEEKFKQIIL